MYKLVQRSALTVLITTSDRLENLLKSCSGLSEKRIKGVVLLDGGNAPCASKFNTVPFDSCIRFIRMEAVDEVIVDLGAECRLWNDELTNEFLSMGITVHIGGANGTDNVKYITKNNRFLLGIKRLFDIAFAFVGLVISIPVIAITAIPLKLESKGPLIFVQKRLTVNGRVFKMHKVRSMYVDAEEMKAKLAKANEMQGNMFKIKNDPRVTKVGKVIRAISIDELPQFYDILIGNMSVVGTRPPTYDEFLNYESHHKRRLSMRTGLTGMWQVSGRNNIADFEEIVKLDTKYIDNWSLWLDIKILFKTVKTVLFERSGI